VALFKCQRVLLEFKKNWSCRRNFRGGRRTLF